ncbi:MAG: hypothetical protein COV47_05510 [Candidatus Diapherotrites archaeon CG11_big_fil_rev_8_21_14_0_20_37_9]|nr:MAG: hypothetical protein COV47_05510 [Candidatus Diapherotrites archaeon CG11_big_fil_rev_8_21_14_0_20_37_9]
MDRNLLYAVLSSQQEKFFSPQTLFHREMLPKVISLLNLKLPLIITGVRRCGKSSLMVLIRDELKLSKKDCLFVDFSDERFIGFDHQDFQKINDYLVENNYSDHAFLFIDEAQEVSHWEKWVNRLKEAHSTLVTGSNSKMLSKEISTTLTGRSVNLHLEPFSFREFLLTKKIDFKEKSFDFKQQALIRKAFLEYHQMGGFPKLILSGDETILKELYENILYRDVVARLGKDLEKPVKELSAYFLSNISEKVSSRKAGGLAGIKNLLGVKKVLNAFENSFLFIMIPKFDYSIRKQIQNPKKVYCVDNGFVTVAGFRFSDNEGKLLENLVLVELKRRSKEVYYSSDKKECDFVIKEKTRIVQAVQVTWKLTVEDRERELSGLLEAMEKFDLKEGLILTNDQEEEIKRDQKKVLVKPTWKWLLETD